MSFLSGIFGGGSNAPGAAMPYYQQIPGVYNQYMQPWIDRGNAAYGEYSGKLNDLLNDPTGFINGIMSQYQASPQYQTDLAAATQGENNSAAAGGTLGTGASQAALAAKSSQLANQYQQQYLQNALGVFGSGLQGEGHLSDQGFDASGTMAQALAQNLQDEGGLAYQQAEDQDNGLAGLISGLGGLIGIGSKNYFGKGPTSGNFWSSLLESL